MDMDISRTCRRQMSVTHVSDGNRRRMLRVLSASCNLEKREADIEVQGLLPCDK